MNIFMNFKQTPYTYYQRQQSDTWTGGQSGRDYQSQGVWKPRNSSNVPTDAPDELGAPTLNIHPGEPFITADVGEMIGDTVTVNGKLYRVSGVTTAENYRTGQVEHYRLMLEEKFE